MIALPNQSIFDIALMLSGSSEAAFQLALQNNISITDNIAGIELTEPAIINRQIVNHYKQNNILPATADHQNLQTWHIGIGNMAIQYDFIIN
jgi:hypothetical protein